MSATTAPECPVCKEEYDVDLRSPRVLKECMHTLCHACVCAMKTCVKRTLSIKCPLCKTTTIVPKKTGFPRNFALEEQIPKRLPDNAIRIRGMKVVSKPGEPLVLRLASKADAPTEASAVAVSAGDTMKCARCTSNDAVYGCADCAVNYCDACWNAVHCVGVLRKHEKRECTRTFLRTCEKHPSNVVDQVCLMCPMSPVFMCPECTMEPTHSEHVIFPLGVAYDTTRTMYDVDVAEAESIQGREDQAQQMARRAQEFKVAQIRESIDKEIGTMVARLERRRTSLHDIVTESMEHNVTMHNVRAVEREQFYAKIREVAGAAKEFADTADAYDFLERQFNHRRPVLMLIDEQKRREKELVPPMANVLFNHKDIDGVIDNYGTIAYADDKLALSPTFHEWSGMLAPTGTPGVLSAMTSFWRDSRGCSWRVKISTGKRKGGRAFLSFVIIHDDQCPCKHRDMLTFKFTLKITNFLPNGENLVRTTKRLTVCGPRQSLTISDVCPYDHESGYVYTDGRIGIHFYIIPIV